MDKLTARSSDENANGDDNREEPENANGDDDREEPENPTRAALDELLQTEANLKGTVESKYESKRQWRQRDSALRCSNWKLELELRKLRVVSDELDGEVFTKADDSQKAYDDIEAHKLRHKQEAADFWTYFQEETQKYSNLFTNAHIEYSSICLTQDIEEYRKESDIVRSKIARIESEMEAARTRYGVVELGTNEEAKLLADLEAVKKTLSDKGNIIRASEAAEEVIKVLKLKVKQKKHDIAYLKNKSCKK